MGGSEGNFYFILFGLLLTYSPFLVAFRLKVHLLYLSWTVLLFAAAKKVLLGEILVFDFKGFNHLPLLIPRLFEPVTMKYIATLPKPHPLGIDVAHSVGTRFI